MGETTAAEYQLARKTAAEYRAKGYTVETDVPVEFFPGYRADLIVRKDNQAKIIEVKTRSALASASLLDKLAKQVEDRPGWSFELLLVAEPERLESPDGPRSLERDAVAERIDEAEALLAAGHAASAFLLAWSGCEAALRLLVAGQGPQDVGIETTSHTLRQAAFLGLISEDEYGDLRSLQRHRNALVHGLSDAAFSGEHVRKILRIVRDITATIV